MKVCSHTLAIAIRTDSVKEFVKAYRSRKHKPSFTALAEAGKPQRAGKKPKRKGISKKSGAQIKKLIADAEASGMEWQSQECDGTKLESDDSEHLDELSDSNVAHVIYFLIQ